MRTTISLNLRIRLSLSLTQVMLLVVSNDCNCSSFFLVGERRFFHEVLVTVLRRTQNKTISCSPLEPPFYSSFARCLKAGILSFSVLCIPTRDTHITSDMCTEAAKNPWRRPKGSRARGTRIVLELGRVERQVSFIKSAGLS